MPLYNLMEDAATAEISRTQVWQWINNPRGVLNDGRRVTLDLVRSLAAEELGKIRNEVGHEHYDAGKFREAAELFDHLVSNDELIEFLTLEAYEKLP